MRHRDASVAERPGLQPLRLRHGGGGGDGLRLVDGRADDVDLPAPGDLLAHELVAGLALRLVDEPRHHRLPARRDAGDGGHVQVAEHGQGERPRDGRRRHVQHVRGDAVPLGPAGERVALLHAEAVLLVDDQQREPGEAHVLLQEGVRPDREPGLARGEAAERRPPLRRGQRRRHQLRRREGAGQSRRRLRVLRGERLRRGEEHALEAGLRGAQQAVEGDDRLARAHVALQQAPHRDVPAQVALQLVQRPELVRGELERQALEERPAELSGLGQRRRVHALLLLRLVPQQPDLHQQQFLEHQALARGAGLRERPREVHGRDRVGPAGQALAHQQLRRQGVGQAAHDRRDGVHQRAQQLGRHLLAGGVHRHHALGVHALPDLLVEDLVPLDHERLAPALRPEGPAQAQPHALLQDPRQVLLVEPDRVHGAGVVAQQDPDDVDPPARRALGAHAHDLAADGRLLPDLEVADGLAVAEVLVAPREVAERGRRRCAGRTRRGGAPRPA